MHEEPQAEHHWLDPLVGEWTVESECQMGPDQSPMQSTGRTTCRSLGGLWFVMEGEGEVPGGGSHTSILSIGYDPQQKTYVGSFIASMMAHLWIYSRGSVDESGRKLVLEAEGPNFEQGGMASYQDLVEIVDQDHWILSSQILGNDGQWSHFMTAHHRRAN